VNPDHHSGSGPVGGPSTPATTPVKASETAPDSESAALGGDAAVESANGKEGEDAPAAPSPAAAVKPGD
ncbi:uncharacterized protein TM35_000531370, partial [Trypanosoma theileri]